MDNDNCSVTYSATCMPPKELLQLKFGDKRLQRIDIRFPTFMGVSKGFVSLNNSWRPINVKLRRPQEKVTVVKNPIIDDKNEMGLEDFAMLKKQSQKIERQRRASYQPNKGSSKTFKELENNHLQCERGELPINYQPRHHNRSFSHPKLTSQNQTKLERQNDIKKNFPSKGINANCNHVNNNKSINHMIRKKINSIQSNSNTNRSNCYSFENANDELVDQSFENKIDDNEWIELYFQLPNGTKQKIQMRQRAVFKHAIRAMTARLGYRSINDLVFLRTSNHKSKYLDKGTNTHRFNNTKNSSDNAIFINDTPKSIGMFSGEVITVANIDY